MECDSHLGGGTFKSAAGAEGKLCTQWSSRLTDTCLPHLFGPGARLSAGDVARSTRLIERALIHCMGSAQSPKMEHLADAYLTAAAPTVPHLLSLASRTHTHTHNPPPSEAPATPAPAPPSRLSSSSVGMAIADALSGPACARAAGASAAESAAAPCASWIFDDGGEGGAALGRQVGYVVVLATFLAKCLLYSGMCHRDEGRAAGTGETARGHEAPGGASADAHGDGVADAFAHGWFLAQGLQGPVYGAAAVQNGEGDGSGEVRAPHSVADANEESGGGSGGGGGGERRKRERDDDASASRQHKVRDTLRKDVHVPAPVWRVRGVRPRVLARGRRRVVRALLVSVNPKP